MIAKAILALMFAAMPAVAAEKAAGFLGRGYADCDRFFDTAAVTDFSDTPDFFVCHQYRYKPVFIYGYMRDLGRGRFSMTLVKGRRTVCRGQGDLVWSGPRRDRRASASGRFSCDDGAEGGYAFELETIEAGGERVIGGTIYGGVDENGNSGVDEEIDADFYIFTQAAMRAILRER